MPVKPLTLSTPVDQVYLIGPTQAKRLTKLGIKTVVDLLQHFPSRYQDYSLVVPIEFLQPGEIVTVQGKMTFIEDAYTKKGKRIQKGLVKDHSGALKVVWYNQPFLTKSLRPGTPVSLAGKVSWFGNSVVLESPEYEILRPNKGGKRQTIHTGRLVPIYHETHGLSSKWLRSRIAHLLNQLRSSFSERLPSLILSRYKLMPYSQALIEIHFPQSYKTAQEARRRLSFDELFFIQLASRLRRLSWGREKVGHRFRISAYKKELSLFFEKLPFSLTSAQRRVVSEIFADMAQSKPMNRLLGGDVGSGKTVVAAIAMYVSFLNGFQSTLMAPTEILAQQHHKTISELLTPLGVKIQLRTGSSRRKGKGKREKDARLDFDVFIGTHALLSEKLNFDKLSLVVIDEQQRFGVEQRAILRQKGINPHLLTMTATPIPRTMALTLYGELDYSYLDELPSGRKRVKTWVVPPEKRQAAYKWIREKVKNTSQQAFIICPLIEESETLTSVKAVKKEHQHLCREVFNDLSLGLLHGRLKAREKEKVLADFRSAKYDILVSTPVVEVGIDIPSATVMMIEGAERFGLSQLHQLRGRVGRGDQQSYCLLFTETENPKVLKRLKYLERIYIGSELAEIDLKLRGPGEIYGTAQHGLARLKIASLSDRKTLEQSQEAVNIIMKKDPTLSTFPLLRQQVNRYTIKPVAPD